MAHAAGSAGNRGMAARSDVDPGGSQSDHRAEAAGAMVGDDPQSLAGALGIVLQPQ